MIRGTTATFKFTLPYVIPDEIAGIEIKLWQPENYVSAGRSLSITKILNQCSYTPQSKDIYVTYTPEETARFSDKLKARIQLKGRSAEGVVFATEQEMVTVYPIYDDSMLEDITPSTGIDGDYIILDAGAVTLEDG